MIEFLEIRDTYPKADRRYRHGKLYYLADGVLRRGKAGDILRL